MEPRTSSATALAGSRGNRDQDWRNDFQRIRMKGSWKDSDEKGRASMAERNRTTRDSLGLWAYRVAPVDAHSYAAPSHCQLWVAAGVGSAPIVQRFLGRRCSRGAGGRGRGDRRQGAGALDPARRGSKAEARDRG